MAMKTEYDAPAPFDYEVWQPDPDWDCSPELQPIERDTLGRCEQVPDMRSCLSSGAMEQGSL